MLTLTKTAPWTVSPYYQMNPQYSFYPAEKGQIELIFCPIHFFFISHPWLKQRTCDVYAGAMSSSPTVREVCCWLVGLIAAV